MREQNRERRLRLAAGGSITAVPAVFLVAALAGAASGAVSASPPANTAAPTTSGTARAGQVLSATSGSWSGTTPMIFSYQWQRCDTAGAACAAIDRATSQT